MEHQTLEDLLVRRVQEIVDARMAENTREWFSYEQASGYLGVSGQRGWVKVKNRAYWRRDAEIEAMQKSAERARLCLVVRT